MTSLNRREFINKMMRWGLTGLLSGSAFYLLTRSSRTDHQCIQKYPSCRDCSENKNCILPQAMSFRNLLAKQENREEI